VDRVLAENQDQLNIYLAGKEGLRGWFVGQVMRATAGQANPALVNRLLDQRLRVLREGRDK
jgi:Asp-tRNA(Asn)/Glu-tRNA(Gln) amidotransferase B subunit